MFLYHWELVPVTGRSNTSVPLSTNQTGRGMSFLLFLPVTVSSISFSLLKLDFRLPVFMPVRGPRQYRVSKRFHRDCRTLIKWAGTEELRLRSFLRLIRLEVSSLPWRATNPLPAFALTVELGWTGPVREGRAQLQQDMLALQ